MVNHAATPISIMNEKMSEKKAEHITDKYTAGFGAGFDFGSTNKNTEDDVLRESQVTINHSMQHAQTE